LGWKKHTAFFTSIALITHSEKRFFNTGNDKFNKLDEEEEEKEEEGWP
jgi:hypothetical protein